ncbi:putative bifunctional diguanylate cyclase/phosphodiesterase [Aliagarivorans marinus]|uniref:putative bifunctional diguanylate cyclase/phosphodiesterase n=1 Tax=Aliagarivorans marinus TaxID=561965 RepID=UPI000403C99D|nr:GGDEF domain-containing phosphodiesterase [Aliagarivorans marinus]
MRNRVSLGITIPLIVLGIFAIVQSVLLFDQVERAKQELAHQNQLHLLESGYQLQQSLSDYLSRHQWQYVQRTVALNALSANLEQLLVVDPMGIVLASSHALDKNIFAADAITPFSHELLTNSHRSDTERHFFNVAPFVTDLYLPLDFGPRDDSLRRSEKGLLVLRLDYSSQWAAYYQTTLKEFAKQFGLTSIGLLALILILKKILLSPLKRISQLTEQLDTLEPEGIPSKGMGEVAALQESLKLIAGKLRDSFNEMEASEQRWQFALSGAGAGVWDWSLLDNEVYYAPQWKAMLGYGEDEINQHIEEWEGRIHPADADKAQSSLRRHLQKETEIFECVHRIRHKKGHYLWVLTRGMVVEHSEQGLPARLICTQTNISETRSAKELLRFRSSHDDVTRLANRKKLIENLQADIQRGQQRGYYSTLIYIDIDHFKQVNDTLGHAVGDLLLRLIAHRLREHRGPADTVARLGGDEFALLLPELAQDPEQAQQIAFDICKSVTKHIHKEFVIKGNPIQLNLTSGIALYPFKDSNSPEVLRQAEIALYRGKELGRAKICVFDESMLDQLKERHQLQTKMRNALSNDEMVAYYQPRYNDKLEMVGAETLIRWFEPNSGWISPGRFIPLAEESGSIVAIGEWVMREACKQLRIWQDRGLPASFTTLSINVSPKQFHRDSFVKDTIDIFNETGIDPQLIELEITEGVLVDNVDATVEKLKQLRDIGVRFSVDDFGTGYSSLAYLNKLPIHCLKIDRSFVMELQSGGSECAIITTIISMADNLELEVIAEGVETEYQLEFLKYRGCRVYQGFLFSEALEPEIFEQRLFSEAQELA